MIYSCLENKTDAKYEVLIFEHFHPSRYLRDERERERKAKYISQMAFSRNVKFPRIFSDARVRGGLLGLNTRGNVTLSLFIYIYVSITKASAQSIVFWGRQPPDPREFDFFVDVFW